MLQICVIVVALVLTIAVAAKSFLNFGTYLFRIQLLKYVGTIKEYNSHMREFRIMH